MLAVAVRDHRPGKDPPPALFATAHSHACRLTSPIAAGAVRADVSDRTAAGSLSCCFGDCGDRERGTPELVRRTCHIRSSYNPISATMPTLTGSPRSRSSSAQGKIPPPGCQTLNQPAGWSRQRRSSRPRTTASAPPPIPTVRAAPPSSCICRYDTVPVITASSATHRSCSA